METLSTVISLAASLASVTLALVAIWIALHGKGEADKTNQKTQDLLTEIRSDAKSIAQYAIPELRAYGDSVRKFVFKKEELGSESVLSRVEEVLAENMKRIDEELDSIRKENDIFTIRKKLDQLESQLKSSQESVRKSVRESRVTVHFEDMPRWSFSPSQWPGFLALLERREHRNLKDYGKSWALVDMGSGRRLPANLIERSITFDKLNVSEQNDLKLIDL
jgi:hypothetical protein